MLGIGIDIKYEYWLFQFLSIFSIIILLCIVGLALYIANLRRTIDQLHAENKIKSIFIKKIELEVKTPINGILGYSEMLKAGVFGQLNIAQKERISDIKTCGNKIGELLEDMSDVSFGYLKTGTIYNKEFNIVHLITEVITSLNSKITANNINVVELLNDTDCLIVSNPKKIRLIIKNIIDNAIKFSNKNGQLTIAGSRDNNYYIIKIADNGIGFSRKKIMKYLPLPNNTQNNESNLHLGLHIVYHFIEQIGGKVEFESFKGSGSTFSIKIPIARH